MKTCERVAAAGFVVWVLTVALLVGGYIPTP